MIGDIPPSGFKGFYKIIESYKNLSDRIPLRPLGFKATSLG